MSRIIGPSMRSSIAASVWACRRRCCRFIASPSSWKGAPRPWHVGILWDKDPRLAKPLLRAFESEGSLIVGDNEPYAGALEGDCMWQHGTMRGLAHAIIEIRQDLIRSPAGQIAWAQRIIGIIEKLRGRADLHLNAVQKHGSHVGSAQALNASTGDMDMRKFDPKTETELEAAAFRRLVEHLRQRTDVQNIDLMNLAGFCRNCLANWYQEAASAGGHTVSKDEAREHVYGMPYKEWQAKHQKEATAEQQAAFAKREPHKH